MRVGVVRELKEDEYRVGLTPAGCAEIKAHDHEVFVEKGAGERSGFLDDEYAQAGAQLATVGDVWSECELIIKVKEPIQDEFGRVRKNQILFTFFHFASSRKLTDAMIASEAICIAYETVADNGRLPLLIPMSEVAGRMAVQEGAHWLGRPYGGSGVLLGGVPGVLPGHVTILGGGVVGTEAARIASGMGASVTVLDVDLVRLRWIEDTLPASVRTLLSNEHNIRTLLPHSDLVIGAVLIHGSRAPHLVTRDMLLTMRKGSVIVDVDVDQGGCIETSRPTTHNDPVFEVDGVLHYCVSNMPGAVPRTSTLALTNVTLPYAIALANAGWEKACQSDTALRAGLNIAGGQVFYPGVAETFGLHCSQPFS